MGYSELIPYATPGLIAFGVFSLPAGWLADRWSREGVMGVFFVGIGLAAIGTSFVQNPIQMAIGLFIIGMFAGIYHPVGLAMMPVGVSKWDVTSLSIGSGAIWELAVQHSFRVF